MKLLMTMTVDTLTVRTVVITHRGPNFRKENVIKFEEDIFVWQIKINKTQYTRHLTYTKKLHV